MSEEVALVLTDSEVKLIREKYAKLSDVEFESFLSAAKRYRLNPLANQIYARLQEQTQKNPRSVTYMTQIDGYRLIADRTNCYAGNDDPVFVGEAQPTKATCTVWKMVEGQRQPFAASAWWKEYCPTGNQDFMWRKMPHLMLGKCAEALALRKAFPSELSGLYTVEEMQQADDDPPSQTTPTTGNPYRDEQNKRAAAKEPVKKSSKEIIASKKTASELTTWLMGVQEPMPVKDNIDKWKSIIDDVDAYVATTKWTDPQKKAVTAMVIAINTEIQQVELDQGMKEAVDKDADPETAPADNAEVPA